VTKNKEVTLAVQHELLLNADIVSLLPKFGEIDSVYPGSQLLYI
jgi:hypothetical protein